MTNFTKEEFRIRYGYDLDQIIPDDHDSSSKTDRAIVDVTELIKEYILSASPRFDFDDVSEAQNSYINTASMEQLIWHYINTDFSRRSGYNAVTDGYQPMADLQQRVICPNAKRILNNHIICRCF